MAPWLCPVLRSFRSEPIARISPVARMPATARCASTGSYACSSPVCGSQSLTPLPRVAAGPVARGRQQLAVGREGDVQALRAWPGRLCFGRPSSGFQILNSPGGQLPRPPNSRVPSPCKSSRRKRRGACRRARNSATRGSRWPVLPKAPSRRECDRTRRPVSDVEQA